MNQKRLLHLYLSEFTTITRPIQALCYVSRLFLALVLPLLTYGRENPDSWLYMWRCQPSPEWKSHPSLLHMQTDFHFCCPSNFSWVCLHFDAKLSLKNTWILFNEDWQKLKIRSFLNNWGSKFLKNPQFSVSYLLHMCETENWKKAPLCQEK